MQEEVAINQEVDVEAMQEDVEVVQVHEEDSMEVE